MPHFYDDPFGQKARPKPAAKSELLSEESGPVAAPDPDGIDFDIPALINLHRLPRFAGRLKKRLRSL